MDVCRDELPPVFPLANGGTVRCHLPTEDDPGLAGGLERALTRFAGGRCIMIGGMEDMPEATQTIEIPANGFVFTADSAGDPDAELVLFLHGFPQTRHTWRAELTAVEAAGFRGLAPDQRGYSPGARPAGVDVYRVENLIGDALAIADEVGADRFHLVGHDWGGQLAWILAARFPHRVRTLSIISRPHPQAFVRALNDDPEQSSRSSHHRSFLRPEATDELLADDGDRLRRLLGRNGVPTSDVDAYLTVLGDRSALDAAINWYRAGGGSALKAPEVPAVTAPTLYVWGTADVSVGRSAAESTAAYVTGKYRFVEVPDVGHFVTDEAPDVFAPLLLEQLEAAAG
jgi:pimeloyl-ACP methyl ester carboxylesterase